MKSLWEKVEQPGGCLSTRAPRRHVAPLVKIIHYVQVFNSWSQNESFAWLDWYGQLWPYLQNWQNVVSLGWKMEIYNAKNEYTIVCLTNKGLLDKQKSDFFQSDQNSSSNSRKSFNMQPAMSVPNLEGCTWFKPCQYQQKELWLYHQANYLLIDQTISTL